MGCLENRWVTRFSKMGHPYQVLKPSVPRIPDNFLDCVVYLYPSEAAAEDGERMGGSGFLLGIHIPFESPPKAFLICVVTNRHIVDGGSMVVRINTHSGVHDIIPLDHAKWFLHPDGDDIAICPIGLHFNYHKFRFIIFNEFARREILEMFDIGPGDDVFVVGRFINREGKQKNTPTVRFGNIAQMPIEPIISDGFHQESYLVEGRSIPGYSGSPVFVHFLPEHPELEYPEWMPNRPPQSKRPKITFRVNPFFLGINFCHIFNKDKVMSGVTGKQVHDYYVESNTGMMGVIPAWKIWEVIDGDEMKAVRNAAEAQVKKASDQVTLDAASGGAAAPDENPNHLEDFNRLVDVAVRKRPQGDQP